jgi:hypothetical protein
LTEHLRRIGQRVVMHHLDRDWHLQFSVPAAIDDAGRAPTQETHKLILAEDAPDSWWFCGMPTLRRRWRCV